MMDYRHLRQSGEKSQRYLSIPFSRLVLNPYNFDGENLTHPQYSDRPSLPLNVGYLDPYSRSGTGVWLEDLITLQGASAQRGGVLRQPCPALAENAPWRSSAPHDTTLCVGGGRLSLTVHRSSDVPWQCAVHPVSIDLDTHPLLILSVESCDCGGRWAVKMCEQGQSDVVVISDKIGAGTFSCDLARALGRTGRYEGEIKLFAVGYDQTLTVNHIGIAAVTPAHNDACRFSTAWTPDALEFEGDYENGLSLRGFDTFFDESTVLRKLAATAAGALTVCGRICGRASFADNVLPVDCSTFSSAISAHRPISPVYYPDLLSMQADTDRRDTPDACLGFALAVGALAEGEALTLAVTVRSDATPLSEVATPCRAALEAPAEEARAARIAYWTDYLARVPHPAPVELTHIDPMGVTAEQLEQTYLIGWIFVAQSLLPENPELDYPYAQVCCGKPSMWAYGDEKSAYSASWESFFGMQMLGFVMPDAAWSALEGLLSLVDGDGMLGGESLPSEKAHTAYVLYRHTGDTARLARVYDAIGRYLCWRIENPRWIYLDHNDPDCADADFIVSALIDIEYMQKIAEALGKQQDVSLWQARYRKLLRNYYRWSFGEDGFAYQMCNRQTMVRDAGHPVWVTKGLLVRELDKAHEEMLMRRLMSVYREDCAFGGLDDIVKYPVYSQTVLGLHRIGRDDLARTLVEMSLRDIVRVGMFSENYSGDPVSTPTGVRPSMFGCAMMLDSTMLLGGFSSQRVEEISLG